MKCIVICSVAFLALSCTAKKQKTTPQVQNITESVYASGVVKSRDQYQAFATVSGIINDVLVSEGDEVKKGQPIIKLRNEAATLNRENARLAAEYATVQSNQDRLNELKANIDLARIRLQNDSLLLVRQRNLWDQQIGTRIQLEQRELDYKNALTAYKALWLQFNDLKKQIVFSARQSQNNLEITSTLSNDYIIKSEVDGRVYDILKKKGELVGPQVPVAVIGHANDFKLELEVDEYDIARVQPGQKVLISMDSYKGQVFEGIVTKIDPIMNERSRTFTVDASFTTRPPNLYPLLTIEANILVRTKQNALTIPREYLVDDEYVLLKNGDRKKVTVGLKDYQKVEILSGLQKDEVIIKPEK